MELEQKIVELVESILEKEYFLVDVQIKQLKEKKKVMVFLDGDKGINIDTCAKVNRTLGDYIEQFDWIDSPYTLEVSSPGVDNPLKLPRQYPQHIGRNLQIKDKNKNIYEGTLMEVGEKNILIEQKQGKGKKVVRTPIHINFENIETAKVLISFK
ncbi:MAG: ribosome maturation factor RimP [Raineya sp.]